MAEPHRYTGPEVRELRDFYWPLMVKTRKAAAEDRAMLAGELSLTFPESVALVGGDAWIGDMPHKRTGPQRTLQTLMGREYEVKRPVTSGGPRAASVSTRIEQPVNAIMHSEEFGFPDQDVKDLLLIEGIAFTTYSVDTDEWRKTPGLYKPNARGLDAKYLEDRFAVDAAGAFRGDKGYDEASVDMDKARREADAEKRDHLARNLPFRQRAYSIRSCAPIWGDTLRLEGLIIEKHWTVPMLRRAGIYVSKHKDGSDARLYPLGALGEGDTATGMGTPVKTLEMWMLDDEGIPYVSTCFDGPEEIGHYAWRKSGPNKDGDYEANIRDLSKLCTDERGKSYGFSRLPIAYGLGLGWPAASDWDQKAMGVTAPFRQSNKNIDMIVTEVIVAGQWLAMPALIEKVSIAEMSSENLDEKTDRRPPDILPLKITQVTGDITNVGGQGPHPSMLQTVSMLQGENKAEQPGGDSGSAPSGFAQTLQTALETDALTTINKSALKMASQHASFTVEAARFLGEAFGEPIRVYQIADVLLEQKHPSDTDQMLTLEPGLIGSSFDVRCIEKIKPGSNPAKRQQDAALAKEGFYSKAWVLEQDGYPSPESMANEVAWEHLVESEPGQQTIMRILESYVSNKFVTQIQEAIAAGQANQQGLATGTGDATSPPPDMLQSGPQATGGMAGMGQGNPAASALAGQVAGPLQTQSLNRVAQAGGELPASALISAVR